MLGLPRPRSLVLATNIDVLADDASTERVADHLIVRTPGQPGFWWGNFLIFDDPPGPGDGPRWEAAFDAAFADAPAVRHRALTWDRGDGDLGAAHAEFVDRGYRLERAVGLRAAPRELHPHPRANTDVVVRALDPDGDEPLWNAQVAMHLADHDPASDPPLPDFESFTRERQRARRRGFRDGRGAWYVALDPDSGELCGGCGVVATDGRGRFQDVHVACAHRGRGIASRLVADAATDAARRHDLRMLVIAADADHHALGIYESLGFVPRDRVVSLTLPPDAGVRPADAG